MPDQKRRTRIEIDEMKTLTGVKFMPFADDKEYFALVGGNLYHKSLGEYLLLKKNFENRNH